MTLDADGRCLLTELLPDQCGCKEHRNSPDVKALSLSDLQVAKQMDALYNGRCAIDAKHKIEPEDEIYLITPIAGGDPVGWACKKCAAAVING